ncbi:PAS domain-containing protein [Blastopirellula marina]|uniref:histidine kinase n=1 Tax=Blastopirellula marina DSM 3645 TaxID=314230 RepID=A3ZMP8_9BACT|nr:PAS domain-containing protein [Blastopirellula marina]EAQ82221.1 sensor histidine kinase [Blastopirellula marina DSM 3645]
MDSPSPSQQIAQLEQRLRESESQCAQLQQENNDLTAQLSSLRGLAENLPCFLFQTLNKIDGTDFSMTYVGSGIHRFGYSPQEIYDRPELMIEMIHPDDRGAYFALVDDCLNDASLPFQIDMRLVSPSGDIRWGRVRSSAVRVSGEYLQYNGVCIDITEEKLTAARLSESESQLKLALTPRDFGAFIWDLTTDLVTLNSSMFPAFGRPTDSEVIHVREFFTAVHPDDRQRVREVLERVIASENAFEDEFRVVWPDGSIHYLSDRAVVQRDATGRAVLMCGVCWDVTPLEQARGELENKVVEKSVELEAISARWQAISDCSPDFIMTLDRDGVTRYINRTAPGVTVEDVLGRPMMDFATPEDAAAITEHMRATLENGEMRSWETKFPHGDGVLDLLVRCSPLVIDGEIQGAVIASTDVSELRKMQRRQAHDEQLLRELWQLQEKERQLTALEIHDGFVQYVVGAQFAFDAVRYRLQDEQHPALEDQVKGLEMLRSAIVEARRTISRLRPLVIDDDGLVESLRYLAAEESDRYGFDAAIECEGEYEDLDPLLMGAMFRIVQEGVSNVRRHSGVAEAHVKVKREGDRIAIEIQDNGKGFDLSKVSNERFGVRGIVERARLFGGSAAIDSAPGKGTRIQVKLPTLARQTELHALLQTMAPNLD